MSDRFFFSPSARYVWITGWQPAIGLDKVKPLTGVLKPVGSGTPKHALILQTATVRATDPDTPVVIGTTHTDAGAYTEAPIDITDNTDGKALVRFGVKIWTDSNDVEADLQAQLRIERYGKVVANKTITCVVPGAATSYAVLTDWLPTPMVSKMTAAFIVTNAHADFRYKPVWQLVPTTKDSSTLGAWTDDGSGWKSAAELCTSEIPIAVSQQDQEMWVRFGVQFTSNSAANITGTLAVVIGIRK